GEGLDRRGAGAFPYRGRRPRRLKAGPPLRNLPLPQGGRGCPSPTPQSRNSVAGPLSQLPRLPNKESLQAMRLPTLLPLVLLNLLLLAASAPWDDDAKGEAAAPAAPAEIQVAAPCFSAGTAAEKGAGPVYRSTNDDRQYRHPTLAYGLDVLLISD